MILKTGIFFAALALPVTAFSVITTYNIDKEQVCTSISNSPNFEDFLSLRDFFRINPAFVSEMNLADPHYCFKLQLAYGLFHNSFNGASNAEQFYAECINMDDQAVGFQNQSFIMVQNILLNCHLK